MVGKTVIIIGVQILGFWPVWSWYLARVSDGSDEPWGILALITALLFLFSERGRARQAGAVQTSFAFALMLVYAGTFLWVPAIVRAGLAVLSLAFTLSALCGGQRLHLGLCALLLLSLPLVASLQFYLGYPLRFITTALSAQAVTLLGFDVQAVGTHLHWQGEIISVDAPCSGIRMLWSGLYMNFTLACFARLGTLATWISYSCSCLLIFLANLLRTTALFFSESNIVSAPQWLHQAVGVALFALLAAALLLMHGKLRHLSAHKDI